MRIETRETATPETARFFRADGSIDHAEAMAAGRRLRSAEAHAGLARMGRAVRAGMGRAIAACPSMPRPEALAARLGFW